MADSENLHLPPAEGKGRKKPRLALLLLLLLLAFGAYFYVYSSEKITSLEAVIGGESYLLPAPLAGLLGEVLVDIGADVQAGEPLFSLDIAALQEDLLEAEAAIQAISAGLPTSGGDFQNLRQAIEVSQNEARRLRSLEDKQKEALNQSSVDHGRALLALRALKNPTPAELDKARAREVESRQSLDKARDAFESASQQRVRAEAEQQRLRLLLQNANNPASQMAAWQAQWTAAAKALDNPYIYAPEAGLVLALHVHAGDKLQAGQGLLDFLPQSQAGPLLVQARFDSEDGIYLKEEQTCQVELDSGQQCQGQIQKISREGGSYLAEIRLEAVAAERGALPGHAVKVQVALH